MGHEPREEAEDAVHHVYARGNGRQDIYVDDQDRRTYLAMLRMVVRRHRWRCLAYCL
jgi:putative transposase